MIKTRCADYGNGFFEIDVQTEEKENYTACRILKKDMQNAAYVDIVPQLTEVRNKEGFLVAPDGLNCYLVKMGDEEKETHHESMPTVLFTGAKNELGTNAVVLEGGMKCEVLYVFERKAGLRAGYFRLRFKEDGFKPYDDITFRIYRLSDNGDYNEMARIYREFKREKGLKSIREKNREAVSYAADALEIRVRMAWKPVPSPIEYQTRENEPPVYAAVTFERLNEVMLALNAKGVKKAQFCLVGWNVSGHDGRYPEIFPVEKSLGGEEKLKKSIALAQKLGYKIVCHTNSSDAYSIAESFSINDIIVKADGERDVTKTTWGGGIMHRLNPHVALKQAKELLPKVRALGFEGVHYIDVLSVVRPYFDFNEKHFCNRTETVKIWGEIADLASGLFGGIGSEGTFDMVGDKLDFALYSGFSKFSGAAEDDEMKLIPLWELVYHGSIFGCPSSDLVNISLTERKLQLKLIEFGGRPAMYINSRFVTESEKRKNWMGANDVRVTTDEELEKGVNALVEADKLFEPLKYLQFEFMTEHRVLENGLVRVTYSDGSRIYVNYFEDLRIADGVSVPPLDYVLIKQ